MNESTAKKQIQFRLDEQQIEKAKSLLIKFETLSDFVREAIDNEIAKREKPSE